VTSVGFGGHFGSAPGVPASVTSPGFGQNSAQHNNLFFSQPACCVNPLFPIRTHPVSGQRRRRTNSPFAGPVYAVPYYVYPEVDEPVDDTMEQVQPQPGQYLGGPTIFDRRGTGPAVYVVPVEKAPAKEAPAAPVQAAPAPEPPPVADQPETVLIFKDGRKVEVHNYAIVGDVLYDMTPGHPRKVQLAELNLDATIKQNDDHGVDFRLPPRTVAK
jgi:hypothetical protein